jgi:methyl-accepting chemotaxis protein
MIRFTRNVFINLAFWEIGFGFLIGLAFPFFVAVMGVPHKLVLTPWFFVTCICAGILVGAVNIGLTRIVIGRRVQAFSERMRSVQTNLLESIQSDDTELLSSEDCFIEVDSDDAIGESAQAFNDVVETLGNQSRRTLEGANVLSTAVAEITATASQLAASNSNTFAAVTEISTTVEQVREAARVTGEKAKGVAESSRKSVEISLSGSQATQDTIQRMNLIKQQMQSIGETVVRLSEHSQAIEQIIGSVQDLADQSNLLAVNASIEAARAGDQGKGFAVVADEIKNLSDQSKDATDQVRKILEETRDWVDAVVEATEQGSKAVDAGLEQSVMAGGAILSLADTVEASAQAASVIDTSTGQQFAGIEQVAGAMTSIEQAIQQSMEGASQLEKAAHRLEKLGGEFTGLQENYETE